MPSKSSEGPGGQPGQGSQAEENLTPESLGLSLPNLSGRPCAWPTPHPTPRSGPGVRGKLRGAGGQHP